MPRGLKGLVRRSGAPLRRDRRRDELRQVPRRRARARRRLDAQSSTASEITRLGEGLDGTDELQPEPMRGPWTRSPGMVDEARGLGATAIAAVGTAGMRLASNRDALVDAVERATRSRDRGHLGRGGEPARLPRGARRASGSAEGTIVVFDTGGGSSQFTFGIGRYGRRALQRRRRRGALHRALRPRRTAVSEDVVAARQGRDRDGPAAARRPAATRRARRARRRRHEPRCRQARPGDLRPGRRPGNRPRRGRDRPADRALPHAHRRRAARDRRAPAQAGRGRARRARASCA